MFLRANRREAAIDVAAVRGSTASPPSPDYGPSCALYGPSEESDFTIRPLLLSPFSWHSLGSLSSDW